MFITQKHTRGSSSIIRRDKKKQNTKQRHAKKGKTFLVFLVGWVVSLTHTHASTLPLQNSYHNALNAQKTHKQEGRRRKKKNSCPVYFVGGCRMSRTLSET